MSSRARIRLPVGIELSCPKCPPNIVPKVFRTVERKAERNFEQEAENVLVRIATTLFNPRFSVWANILLREGMKVRIVLLFQSKTTNKRASPRRRQSSPHTFPPNTSYLTLYGTLSGSAPLCMRRDGCVILWRRFLRTRREGLDEGNSQLTNRRPNWSRW